MGTRKALAVAAGAVVLTVLTGVASAVVPDGPKTDEDIRREVASVAEELAAQDRFSGYVLVAKDGVPILSQGYGLADREDGVPHDATTAYDLASVGKMFTAVSIGQLVAQGRVDVDAPVTTYLPDYPPETGDAVTVGDLLAHRSGIPDFFFADRDDYLRVVDSTDPHRDYLELFADEPLAFEPGTRFEYSNSNYLLLGAVVEAVTGEDFVEYVTANVFRPAGMLQTGYDADAVPPGRHATRYTEFGRDGQQEPGQRRRVDTSAVGPLALPEGRAGGHGGALSTPEDMLRFLRALREHTVLDAERVDLLVAGPEGAGRTPYAYGFDTRSAPWWRQLSAAGRQQAVGHSGGTQGVLNHVYMYPGGYDVVVLSNYESGAEDIMSTLDDLLLPARPS